MSEYIDKIEYYMYTQNIKDYLISYENDFYIIELNKKDVQKVSKINKYINIKVKIGSNLPRYQLL